MSVPMTHIDEDARVVKFRHNDEEMTFPFVWLRHNCRCLKCFHHASKAKAFPVSELDLDIKPQHVEVNGNGEMTITWPDEHRTTYRCDWLRKKQLTDTVRQQRLNIYRKTPLLWDSAMMNNNIPTVPYTDLMTKPGSLYQWLKDLEVFGLVKVTGAPKDVGVLQNLGDRVGYLRRGIYGHTLTLKAVHEAQNLAFSSQALTFHVDMPYHEWTPGVQLLHCITQTVNKGGVSVFCDGYKVVETLKEEFPEYFKLLSTEPVTYWHKCTAAFDFDLLSKHPIIELSCKGEVQKIHYSFPFIDFDVPMDLLESMYKATAKFDELLHDARHSIEFKMVEGDIICFDNIRVLHGRTAFTVEKGNERHLEAVYMDWDLLRSNRRVLENELDIRD